MTRFTYAWLIGASTGLAVLMALAAACSSTSAPVVMEVTDSGSPMTDSGSPMVGDGDQNGAAPDALYGACAVKGSFGANCAATTSGPDPTDCTDPAFPDCFAGGQGAWCTKTCTSVTDCTSAAEDGGCAPSACNMKGYCK
jgi:hypothetical protein